MTLRLLKILAPSDGRDRILEILDEHGVGPRWCLPLEEGRLLVEAILPGEGNEPVLDALQQRMGGDDTCRLILVPVQATIPRMDDDQADESDHSDDHEDAPEERAPSRINREELYTSISSTAEATTYYMVMVGLSAVVAGIGLLMNDTAVIIGAMVIAPLLGPNMALAFATTLGDLELGRSALKASATGAGVALLVTIVLGAVFVVDPEGSEVAARTQVGFGHIALALAAGAAGALSLTRGMAAGLVGVMVAVALLPPLAAAGLLIGAGLWGAGASALLLVVANVACVNLAGIGAFLAQGVQPLSWWEGRGARRAARVAVILWAGLVLVLLAAIWLTPEG